jgi:cysteine desulfurase
VAKNALLNARKNVADLIGGHADEIIFTSGGTESNNGAIFGVVNSLVSKGVNYKDIHIISSNVEHSSVVECLNYLISKGVKVDFLKVDSRGLIDGRDLRKLLNKKTVLVSVMYANNEIGTIQPIKEIAKEIRHFRKLNSFSSFYPYFHVDASQAFCYEDLKVESLGVDLISLDGQKVYGPKGVGALFVKRGLSISPINFGGGQEGGLRSGTPNVPSICAFAKALSICDKDREKEVKRILPLRDFLIKEISKIFDGAILNGDLNRRLVNNINFSLPNCDTEMLALRLDSKGFSVSTKSACLSSEIGSYVVSALEENKDSWRSKNTLRITLGRYTSKDDCKKFIKALSLLKKKFF